MPALLISNAEAEALQQEGEREHTFWDAHYDAFLERYPEQYVAVKDGEVIATSPDLFDLVDQVEQRGLKPTEVWARFFTKETVQHP